MGGAESGGVADWVSLSALVYLSHPLDPSTFTNLFVQTNFQDRFRRQLNSGGSGESFHVKPPKAQDPTEM